MSDVQAQSQLFLVFALLACAVTLVSYRRYKLLRGERWRREIKDKEDELGQVLNHARMHVLIEHITGPLNTDLLERASGEAGAGKE
jgi:hypothetical protein